MAIDVFGDGMHHNIGPMIQWVLHVGAQERIVHHDLDSMLMRNCRHSANVHQAQRRVARALNPDKLGLAWPYERRHVDLDAWRESHLNAMCSGNLCKVAMRSTVNIRYGDNMRACG